MSACVDINLYGQELDDLIAKAKDWAVMHSIIMLSKQHHEIEHVHIVSFTLLPTPFPLIQFNKVQGLQIVINELIHSVAYNYEFLSETLRSTIEVDEFTAKLFSIYETVKKEGFVQDISLGLLRSDYMLDLNHGKAVKQIEINTIASSFGGLSLPLSEYHRFILTELGYPEKCKQVPENTSAVGLSSGLIEAWKVYNKENSVVLFVVEDITFNIYDQRVLEFTVRQINSKVKVIRKTLTQLITQAHIGSNRELIVNDQEVAVVYYRSGYQLEAYHSEKEWEVRLMLERSGAIKCPSIQYQLAGTKKVQQKLAVPGILEKFVKNEENLAKLKNVFVGIYSLDFDDSMAEEFMNKAIADPKNYVLKPQREGGGNNLYDEEMKQKLEQIMNSKERLGWIIMDRINPPSHENYILTANGDTKKQMLVSELGIYGVVLGNSNGLIVNQQTGHLIRSKPSFENEGGIVKGAGALDGPFLI